MCIAACGHWTSPRPRPHSVQSLREAELAEEPERERLLKEADHKQKEAWSRGTAGVRDFTRIWERTPVSGGR